MTKDQRDALFTEFVATQSAQLVHFAWLLCGDRGVAEDLVQTALEKSYLRWDRIEMGNPFAYVPQPNSTDQVLEGTMTEHDRDQLALREAMTFRGETQPLDPSQVISRARRRRSRNGPARWSPL